ncbi:uncharacterized protein N7459_006642, partial [Penicillium hispanicum]|uniref:uncharacterized protein n=1 Tax=Penicillium hispanicum TaxID=1080232 RepID=UPI002540FCEA
MRSFIAALFVAGALAQSTGDYLKCAEAALDGIDVSQLQDCSNKSSRDCLCTNKDALKTLANSAASACSDAGIDLSNLESSLCSGTDSSSTDSSSTDSNSTDSSKPAVVPARHASNPMQPAMDMDHHKRADTLDAAPRVVYVTETRTECSCKSTPAPYYDPKHVSQIPVQVPASSSMAGMAAASSPASSNGVMVGGASSSVVFGSQASAATPSPSGTGANRFNAFQGAAPKASAVQGGVAAVAVAAVMGLMVA